MGDYRIRMQFDLATEPGAVRRALTSEEGIASWWSARTSLRREGDRPTLHVSFPDVPQPFEFAVADGEQGPIDWVTGDFPPWWAGTTIRWELAPNPDGPGTRLLFEHGGYDADNPVIPIVTPAWAQIILRLKGYAETGARQPFFDF